MNHSIKMLLTLTVTAVVMGGVLAGFYKFVEPKIEENRLIEEKLAIMAVVDGIVDYEIIEVEIEGKKGPEILQLFRGVDGEGKLVGYAFLAKGPGFAGIISMMVGLKVDLKHLSGMKVLEQIETPGLGNKIVEEKFDGQFRGLAIEPKIEYIKNKKPFKPNQIQAITGATISCVAVVDALNNRIVIVLDVIANLESGGK
ncbi:MAG: FMN-binding protein [Deltaproteobacteria bacterium]|nr:FMN-binding protein [Deltaproteobacteria bacterium]